MSDRAYAVMDLCARDHVPFIPVNAFYAGAVGNSAVVAFGNIEFPFKVKVRRIFANAQTAPGSSYKCTVTVTDGTNTETAEINGSDTVGETKTGTAVLSADTDIDIKLQDDNASGSTADVNVLVLFEPCGYYADGARS